MCVNTRARETCASTLRFSRHCNAMDFGICRCRSDCKLNWLKATGCATMTWSFLLVIQAIYQFKFGAVWVFAIGSFRYRCRAPSQTSDGTFAIERNRKVISRTMFRVHQDVPWNTNELKIILNRPSLLLGACIWSLRVPTIHRHVFSLTQFDLFVLYAITYGIVSILFSSRVFFRWQRCRLFNTGLFILLVICLFVARCKHPLVYRLESHKNAFRINTRDWWKLIFLWTLSWPNRVWLNGSMWCKSLMLQNEAQINGKKMIIEWKYQTKRIKIKIKRKQLTRGNKVQWSASALCRTIECTKYNWRTVRFSINCFTYRTLPFSLG